jgi:hypothetical protein
MATLRHAWLALVLAGCGDIVGFGGDVSPLATIHVTVSGDPMAQAPRVALVWGAQFLIEPLCFLPPESPEVATVLAQGCRDPFGFVPDRVAANAELAGDSVDIPLFDLPAADVMVGDVTARVAYGSLVLYDDRNGDSTLDLGRPRRPPSGNDDMGGGPPPDEPDFDVVHGASFVSMTEPDQRLAFREGAFIQTAFYPRAGCGAPLPAFSVLSAGGFSATDAIASALDGKLPQEDPATCSESPVDSAPIQITVRPPAEVAEVACTERRVDSSTRYREPPVDAPPDLADRTLACAHLPDFGGGPSSDIVQLLVSTPNDARCRGLTHYVLRGCDNDPSCEMPEWDLTATPPSWWPCPTGGM